LQWRNKEEGNGDMHPGRRYWGAPTHFAVK